MNKEQYLRTIECIINSPRNDAQKITMLRIGFEAYAEKPDRMHYAGVDMTDWDFTFNEDDPKFIYKAFVALCNFAEEFIPCGKCPLYELCYSKNGKDGKKFWDKVHRELADVKLK